MRKLIFFVFLFILSFSLLFAHPSHIPVTQLVSPDNTPLLEYQDWVKTVQNTSPVCIGNVGVVERDGGKINVIVNSTLFPKLSFFLNPTTGQYITDLVNDGWTVSVDTMAMSADPFAPETLRNYLISEYNTGSVGAIFIGDIPIAWFQMMEVFWGWTPAYTDFPIDLFYMDLDGVWQDIFRESGGSLIPGSDSIYDTHTGAMEADIFVGRLIASPVGNDSALIHQYLERNHNFRTGAMSLSKEALFYNDDDWAVYTSQWSAELGMVYDSLLVIYDPETTTAVDYRTRLPVSHEWISVFVHSSPVVHSFKYNGGGSWDWFYSYEIPGLNPMANFYNLFACSNTRYTVVDNCGSMYTFRTNYGLGALGSTKTGSMLEFQHFYSPLSQGKCVGDAFKEWFAVMAEAWGDTSRSWFYGMSFIGDASLVVKDSLTAVSEEPQEEKHLLGITVSPNPAYEYVIFRLNRNSKTSMEITVYRIDGRIIWHGMKYNTTSIKWDCSDSPSGLYFCIVSTPHQSFSEKVMIFK